MARQVSNVEIEGKQLSLSNLNKVLYPEVKFTKAQVIDYFVRIAPVLLPHLKGRPLTMKRYPEGVNGMHFYEKNCPSHRPEWVKTAPVWSEGNNRWMHYCLIEDLPTLVWAANLADLELHTSRALAKEILKPTMVVFDLDPGPPADIVQCCQVGMWLRELFDRMGLESFPIPCGRRAPAATCPPGNTGRCRRVDRDRDRKPPWSASGFPSPVHVKYAVPGQPDLPPTPAWAGL